MKKDKITIKQKERNNGYYTHIHTEIRVNGRKKHTIDSRLKNHK